MEIPVTQEEVVDWLQHPVSQALLNHLQRQRQRVLEQWVAGHFQSENPNVTQGANAHALGRIDQIEHLLDIDAEDINE
jgi:hypothetical protein